MGDAPDEVIEETAADLAIAELNADRDEGIAVVVLGVLVSVAVFVAAYSGIVLPATMLIAGWIVVYGLIRVTNRVLGVRWIRKTHSREAAERKRVSNRG